MTAEQSVFEKLLCAVDQPRAIGSMGYEPVFYAVFPPERIRQVRKEITAFKRYLCEHGHEVLELDLSEAVWKILHDSEDWEAIREMVQEDPAAASEDLQATINEIVDSSGDSALVARLRGKLEEAGTKLSARPVVLVTGLEVLHRITRPGTLEARLNGSFSVPTIFFYPGRIEGGAGLSFLGFYPVDSNYRSEHLDFSGALQ